jgi:hypothetical protein
MAKKHKQPKRKHIQELDLADHTTRLRSIPSGPIEAMRQLLIWVAGGILLFALGWMALGR